MHATSSDALVPWVRWGAIAMALTTLGIGLWQAFLPLAFYRDFPGIGHPWIAFLPPYNEHLVRDVGEGNLAMGILFTWGAATLDRRLLRATSVAWIVAASAHFIYLLFNLASFDLLDQITQTIALGVVILLPVLILVGLGRPAHTAAQADTSATTLVKRPERSI